MEDNAYCRFRVRFSGKDYPKHMPSEVMVIAPTMERAEQWAQKQMEQWNMGKEYRATFSVDEQENENLETSDGA